MADHQHAPTPRRHHYFVAMALLLALAACQPAPPPPAKATPSEPHSVAPLPPLRLGWSFNQAPEACHATASSGKVRLEVTVSGHDPIELKLSGLPALAGHAGQRVAWVFSGAAGHWRLLSAVRASHDMVAYIAPGERSAGRVLALLSGGTLTVGTPPPGQRRLLLPASGAAGQTWFDCVRSQR